jgi:hypothetical protein
VSLVVLNSWVDLAQKYSSTYAKTSKYWECRLGTHDTQTFFSNVTKKLLGSIETQEPKLKVLESFLFNCVYSYFVCLQLKDL